MKKITSRQNPQFKHLQKLLEDKAYRYAQKQFVIEGYKTFESATALENIFIAEGKKLPPFSGNPEIIVLPETVMQKISATENSQGVLGVCRLRLTEKIQPDKTYVYLDRLQDPGNLGTIIRTAAAFDLAGVIFGRGCVDPFMPKVVRATMGAIFKIELIYLEDPACLADFNLIAADLHGDDISDYKHKDDFILAIGNEGAGISAEIKSLAKKIVSIPISDRVESLNAAVSAGILTYLLKKALLS